MTRNRFGRRRRRGSAFTVPAYVEQVRRIVRRDGHAVQVVLGNPGEPDWAYTVGLHGHGLPELIVVGGFSIPDQHGMLDELALRMRAGEILRPGQRDASMIDGYDVIFVEVADTTTDDFAVANHLQSDFRALQLVWPDHGNRFPWEREYSIPVEHQRLLGLPPQGNELARGR